MKKRFQFATFVSLAAIFFLAGAANAQQKQIPAPLRPWQDWVTWENKQLDCPVPFNNAQQRICFWPSQLNLTADATQAAWQIDIAVFSESWVSLPGSADVWPLRVLDNEQAIPVVVRGGIPAVKLTPGQHKLSGTFAWDKMPQRIAIPKQIGILALQVEGNAVPLPRWDAQGQVWLKRTRAEEADKDHLEAQVYRVIADGVPTWLETEIELTVSGKSREEQLGWVLPEGWKLSMVESPIPVAINDRGEMKAQVRPGKWTIRLHAFRSTPTETFQYAADARPLIDQEYIGLRARPNFRIAEIEGLPVVDVSQTTFPKKWANLPVYLWNTGETFQLVEKMRGMGLRRPQGLQIDRQLWIDDDGNGLTYRDQITGAMQQTWRLDVAAEQELGAVRIDGQGQLITAHPQTGDHGVEIRKRNLNLQAIGRIDRTQNLSATGWQSDDVDGLKWKIRLPPGWRVLALFGADEVEGDWLTAWTYLDLFLLLIFSMAVFRLWGFKAGIIALLAFGLAYHEPGVPRFTWLFLLFPLALLRVMPEGIGKRLITFWKYAAAALLLLFLVPFVVYQVQNAIYPQLEPSGVVYGERDLSDFFAGSRQYQTYEAEVQYDHDGNGANFYTNGDDGNEMDGYGPAAVEMPEQTMAQATLQYPDRQQSKRNTVKIAKGNLLYDAKAKIQTGPAEPQWGGNEVKVFWTGPVSAKQKVRPIYITMNQNRLLNVARVVLLLLLAGILFRPRKIKVPPVAKPAATAALLLCLLMVPQAAQAQLPDKAMLDTLRTRLLEPSDAFPNAAEIPSVALRIEDNRITMEAEIHVAAACAVPLPGRLPAWSPVSVKADGGNTIVRRHEGYLWITLAKGVHNVTVEGLLPDATEWEWAFLLKPRQVTIDAPGWNATGVGSNGVPEKQVFFARQQKTTAGEAAYDRKNFHAVVTVDRHIEVGLVWRVRNVVTRVSAPGKAVSLRVPLLPGERVLTSKVEVTDGKIDVRLGSNEKNFVWESELPVREEVLLKAAETDQWVERWHLVTSPVWNVALTETDLAPGFESQQQELIPVWRPWPGESVTLTFSRPEAVVGDTITVKQVRHTVDLGARQRTSNLQIDLECSLGSDFVIELDADAEISSLTLAGQAIPVRRDGDKLFVPVRPGTQTITAAWRSEKTMESVADVGRVALPVEASNVTTVMTVPESRWVLWAQGPRRGPAVRFWTILVVAMLMAVALGSVSYSPLRRIEWVLLGIGLTQVSVFAAMFVVGWLFLLAWRGKADCQPLPSWRFYLLQFGIVLLTVVALGVLVAVVYIGLLGDPRMFIVGNDSTSQDLQWSQYRTDAELPLPQIISISLWFYRLFMLFWALWLAASLLRWLNWGWQQFSRDGMWNQAKSEPIPAIVVSEGSGE